MKRLSINKVLNNISELILLLAVSAMMIGNEGINYLYLSVVVLFVVLIVSQNRIMGVSIGILTMFVSLYMMLACISEFSDFPTINKEAMVLLGVGILICSSSLFCSVLLLKKYGSWSLSD